MLKVSGWSMRKIQILLVDVPNLEDRVVPFNRNFAGGGTVAVFQKAVCEV